MKAYIEAQGGLLLVRLMGHKSKPPVSGGMRGRIREFSYKSRLRLMRFMARLTTQNVRATFITLTFKGYPTNAEAKRALHAFMSHLRRTFPQASACWRMEFQRRGSIHFHLLCFNLPYWSQAELQETWTAITGETSSRVDIRLVRSRRGVMSYVSKYLAKVEKRIGKTSLVHVPYLHKGRKWRKGRFWGYHNKKCLPVGELVTGILTDTRTIKRLSDAAWKIVGSATRYGAVGFHLFTEHAESLARRNITVGGLFWDEWMDSRQLTDREHDNVAEIARRFSEDDFENDYAKYKPSTSRPRSARSVQPCTLGWISRSSFLNRLTGELVYSGNSG